MAQLVGTLHVPVDFVLRHAEVMVQHAARPERGGLLVLADADALAEEVAGLVDAGVDMKGQVGMEKPAARKNRNRNHVHSAGARDQVGGHGHLRYFEFLELELAPKSL